MDVRVGGVAPADGTVGFDRSLAGLTGIAVKGFLLTLVTFGIYRFWYMTNLRRFFWSRTTVDGSPAEYTGTGRELFLGFLVALLVLVPIYLGIFLITLLVPPLAAFGGLAGFVVLFVLGQFALYRGRRYRAMRTLWRGIRLGQDGSGLAYAARAAVWYLAVVLTLGLAFPFMRASLERYRIRHTLIGTGRMESRARGTQVLGNWLLLYAVGVLPTLAVLAALWAANGYDFPTDLYVDKPDGKEGLMLNPALAGTAVEQIALALPFVAGLSLAAGFLLFPYYRARETRAFMNVARLGDARLVSTLRARQFYWPYVVYLGLLVLLWIALALVAVAVVVATQGMSGGATGDALGGAGPVHWLLVVGAAVFYLAFALVFAVLHVRVIQARLWAAVADTARISDPGALAAIVASSRGPGSGLSEGMADALDVGGALQIGL